MTTALGNRRVIAARRTAARQLGIPTTALTQARLDGLVVLLAAGEGGARTSNETRWPDVELTGVGTDIAELFEFDDARAARLGRVEEAAP